MIEPFEGRQVREGVISYGVSSYGYDMRVAREFRIFTNVLNSIVDPEELPEQLLRGVRGRRLHRAAQQLRPGAIGGVLPDPRNVLTVTVGKSTYARCGIITNVTPFEPEWEGYVTLEISQHDPASGEDLCQRGDRAGALLRGQGRARGLLPGQEGEIPGPAWGDASPAVARLGRAALAPEAEEIDQHRRDEQEGEDDPGRALPGTRPHTRCGAPPAVRPSGSAPRPVTYVVFSTASAPPSAVSGFV